MALEISLTGAIAIWGSTGRHIFNNLLFLKPEWAIDSEAMRARGIIYCFSKIQLVGPKY